MLLRQNVTHRIFVVVFLHQWFGISMLICYTRIYSAIHHCFQVWRLMKSVEFLCHFNPQVTIGVNGYHTLLMSRRHQVSTPPKASTARLWRRGGMGRGIPISSQVRDPMEHRKLPQRGPGHSPGRNWILHNLNAKEAIWWHVLHWIFYVTVTLIWCSCTWHKKTYSIYRVAQKYGTVFGTP